MVGRQAEDHLQRKHFECGQLGRIAKECNKRTAVETKERSNTNIFKDNFGHMEY